MDLLQNIRIATLPKPLIAVFTLIMFLILCLNGYVIYEGFVTRDYGTWIAAGGYLLGVVLPATLVVLALQFSHTGVHALRDRTAQILTGLIPQQLTLTADCADEAPDRALFGQSKRARRAATKVDVSFFPGECWADYTLHVPTATPAGRRTSLVRIRIEINVRRANVDLFIPAGGNRKPHVHDAQAKHPHGHFPHTLTGAERAGYAVNAETVRRSAGGGDYECLVLIREFPDDFLWNSAEKLWFAQDLMFMLRAFVQEQPELFEEAA